MEPCDVFVATKCTSINDKKNYIKCVQVWRFAMKLFMYFVIFSCFFFFSLPNWSYYNLVQRAKHLLEAIIEVNWFRKQQYWFHWHTLWNNHPVFYFLANSLVVSMSVIGWCFIFHVWNFDILWHVAKLNVGDCRQLPNFTVNSDKMRKLSKFVGR